ncbi:MAG: M64 family metallopeptidase [Ignavibacterium sp.]
MKITITLLLFLLQIILTAQVNFDDYFTEGSLRLDYYHTGNDTLEIYSIDELYAEPFWGGSKKNLLDVFDYGKYKFVVKDEKTGIEIYSRTYSTLFSEWLTTEEAKHTTKSFSETVVFPFPKNKVIVEFYSRDKKNKLHKKFEYKVDASNYFIRRDKPLKFQSVKILDNGSPSEKVDIVMIPDGYTKSNSAKFLKDAERFSNYLFGSSPFKENKDKFNIHAVLSWSEESGTDIPAENIWKRTIANSSFYTFDVDRYLMIYDNKTLRHLASNAPYDQIYVLVNTNKYGGGSIYNHYSVCVSDNSNSEYIFVHEFGHGFASLGDEYYTSEVAYSDFYPLDVEPLDPNLTTLVDFDSKWKDLIEEGTPVPTPVSPEFLDKTGVFEGGGYSAKGVYRPAYDCTMKSISIDNFCAVCRRAIQKMIDFYSN